MIAAGRSWIGNVRSRNEDVALIRPEQQLLAVADGMGGQNGGHIAARVAIDEVADLVSDDVDDEAQLIAAAEKANKTVFARARENAELHGMGATLVMLKVIKGDAVFCHVGDARGYLYRGSEVVQITKDHSVVQDQIDRGLLTMEEAKLAMNRSVVTQAIGPSMVVSPTATPCPIESNDVVLLCSDGLSDVLDEEAMATILEKRGDNLRAAVANLIDEAASRGSTDNITVVLGKFE